MKHFFWLSLQTQNTNHNATKQSPFGGHAVNGVSDKTFGCVPICVWTTICICKIFVFTQQSPSHIFSSLLLPHFLLCLHRNTIYSLPIGVSISSISSINTHAARADHTVYSTPSNYHFPQKIPLFLAQDAIRTCHRSQIQSQIALASIANKAGQHLRFSSTQRSLSSLAAAVGTIPLALAELAQVASSAFKL